MSCSIGSTLATRMQHLKVHLTHKDITYIPVRNTGKLKDEADHSPEPITEIKNTNNNKELNT